MANNSNLSQVQDFLKRCNLVDYYDKFIAEGFDQLQSLLDVTEADLIAMDVKRGHRRRLQREIATARGISLDQPIYIDQNVLNGIPNNIPSKIHYTPLTINSSTLESPLHEGNRISRDDDLSDLQDLPEGEGTKRKYRRHPKRDKNAPVKPLSAYVMFAHKVREEYRGKNIPFPKMAKIIGDRWKTVSAEEKESIEAKAAKAKEKYHIALSVYKTTEDWKKYQEYLKDFKEKNELNSRASGGTCKRQKLEISQDLDTATPSECSSNQSSIGYHADNGSGNLSSGSNNSNGNNNGNVIQGLHHHHASTPPYFHIKCTHGYPPCDCYNPVLCNSDSSASNSFVAPPSSVSHTTNSTILDDLFAKDNRTKNSSSDASEDSSFSLENHTPAAGNSETDNLPADQQKTNVC